MRMLETMTGSPVKATEYNRHAGVLDEAVSVRKR